MLDKSGYPPDATPGPEHASIYAVLETGAIVAYDPAIAALFVLATAGDRLVLWLEDMPGFFRAVDRLEIPHVRIGIHRQMLGHLQKAMRKLTKAELARRRSQADAE